MYTKLSLGCILPRRGLGWSWQVFAQFLNLWIDFTKKHTLTEEIIYLGMYGYLQIHRTLSSFLDTISMIGASLARPRVRTNLRFIIIFFLPIIVWVQYKSTHIISLINQSYAEMYTKKHGVYTLRCILYIIVKNIIQITGKVILSISSTIHWFLFIWNCVNKS